MKLMKLLSSFGTARPEFGGGRRAIAAALAISVSAVALGGCWAIPHEVLTASGNAVPMSKIFPSSLLAEPIQLRAGYAHTTKSFRVEANERWTVSLGFVRNDQFVSLEEKIGGASNTCWIDTVRPAKFCRVISSGFKVQWELVNEKDEVAKKYEIDSLREESGGTYSANAITRGMSGFKDQPPGTYRLKVKVLRDAKELDFLKPHVLVDRPFFRPNSIE